jgi:hypothetical protein
MLDDLNELKTFRAILAEGSLSAAARSLGRYSGDGQQTAEHAGRPGRRAPHPSLDPRAQPNRGGRAVARGSRSSVAMLERGETIHG